MLDWFLGCQRLTLIHNFEFSHWLMVARNAQKSCPLPTCHYTIYFLRHTFALRTYFCIFWRRNSNAQHRKKKLRCAHSITIICINSTRIFRTQNGPHFATYIHTYIHTYIYYLLRQVGLRQPKGWCGPADNLINKKIYHIIKS